MNGGNQANMEPGFQAMARLKPNIHSLQKNDPLYAELLNSGEASLGAWMVTNMKEFEDKGYSLGTTIQLQEGIFGSTACVAIVKGHKAKREALDAFVNRALSVQAQQGIAQEFFESPTNRKVRVPNELLRYVLPAEGSPVKLIDYNLEEFYKNKDSLLDKLNKVLLQ
jgi:putative spermidine/putrescine transport system substrate-binding protein